MACGRSEDRVTACRGISSCSVANLRSFDAWGGVRSGAGAGNPKGRYVANLGHVQDDESGLVYMRARYYEPGTGRFVNQDAGRSGANWFIYCSNNPLYFVDKTGKFEIPLYADLVIGGLLVALGAYMYVEAEEIAWTANPAAMGTVLMAAGVLALIAGAYAAFGDIVGGIKAAYRTADPQHAESLAFALIDEWKQKKTDSAKIGAGLAERAFWMALVQAGEPD